MKQLVSASVDKTWYQGIKDFIKEHNNNNPANLVSFTKLIYLGVDKVVKEIKDNK